MTFDPLIEKISDYVVDQPAFSIHAQQTSCYAFLDSIGCAMAALKSPYCQQVLGPLFTGYSCLKGVPVLGTSFALDPIDATFNLTSMIRWLDYNDTFLAYEWGHPSDNLGAILCCRYYQFQQTGENFLFSDLLSDLIQAYEIQGNGVWSLPLGPWKCTQCKRCPPPPKSIF